MRKQNRTQAAEPLEARRLCAAAPLVLTGGAGANTVYLREDADHVHLDVWQNAATPGGGTPTQAPLIAAITTVAIGGGTGEAVTVDFANGDPFPSTVAVTGGTGTANALVIRGATAVSVGGTGVTVGTTAVSYAKLQSIQIVGTAGNDTLTQTGQPLAPLTFAGGGGSDTLNVNAGTFTLAGDPAGSTANLTVNDAGWLYLTAAAAGTGVNARHLAALNVLAGGAATVDTPVAAADRAVLVVGSLSVAGTFDLTGNDLIVHNGSIATVRAATASSFAADDPTRDSTLAVTPATAGTFDTQTVAATDVVAKYTPFGDANLDGTVDGADYARIDAGYLSHGALTGWANGDFNGDGRIDASDYTLIDNAFNTAAATPTLVYQLHDAIDVADEQARKTVAAVGTTGETPRTVNPDGSWALVASNDWTAGTWPGQLWQLYTATGDPYFKAEATAFATPLAGDDKDTGDVGFQVYDSFYPLMQADPANAATYANVLLTAAASKATDYNATVGAFEAWRSSSSGNPAANFNVLMDYIMDSQLLFWAAKQSGNQTYYNEAVSNATVEATYNVHADGNTSQFSYFNSANGTFVDNETYQGYSNTSDWSRGQAWAIYGFAQCYAASGVPTFLATSEAAANWYLAHLPADDVPYWDFDAPTIPNAPRDTSAAAVAASGLLRLSSEIAGTDPADGARYRTAAGAILASLCSPAYLNNPAAIGDGVLLHGALNVPANNGLSDNSIDFGDYYFAEAINEYLATT